MIFCQSLKYPEFYFYKLFNSRLNAIRTTEIEMPFKYKIYVI